MKRFLSLLIVAVMLVAAIPFGLVASADYDIVVTVQAGLGGSVYYNQNGISSGTTETVGFASSNEKIRVIFNQGYELNRVYLDGKELPVSGNNFQISGLKTGSKLFVTFKKPGTTGIGIDEIDWNAGDIVVPVDAGGAVKREVFEKISILPKNGKYVEFKSENGSYFVPYGGEFSGYADSAVMGLQQVESGNEYDKAKTVFEDFETEPGYKLFRFFTGLGLPQGTKISVNLGKELKKAKCTFYVFDGTMEKATELDKVELDENGGSSQINYSNELFVAAAFDKSLIEDESEDEENDKKGNNNEDIQNLIIIILCSVLILLILIVIIILVARGAGKKKRAKQRAKLEAEAEALELEEKKKAEELARINAMAKSLEDKARADAEKREKERLEAKNREKTIAIFGEPEVSPEEKMKNLVSEAEEKERLAREAEEEAARSVQEALARETAAKQAVEDAARAAEAARVAAAEEAARIAAEKAAAEEAARIAAEKAAAEEAARIAAEKAAAEEAARIAAEKAAAEEAARIAAEKAAAEEAARIAAEKAAAEEAAPQKRDYKFCFNCGTKLNAKDMFCHNCGTKQ